MSPDSAPRLAQLMQLTMPPAVMTSALTLVVMMTTTMTTVTLCANESVVDYRQMNVLLNVSLNFNDTPVSFVPHNDTPIHR